jgi:hypothetical protein
MAHGRARSCGQVRSGLLEAVRRLTSTDVPYGKLGHAQLASRCLPVVIDCYTQYELTTSNGRAGAFQHAAALCQLKCPSLNLEQTRWSAHALCATPHHGGGTLRPSQGPQMLVRASKRMSPRFANSSDQLSDPDRANLEALGNPCKVSGGRAS